MPRFVDPAERTRAIMDAAVAVLAEGGFARLTLRNLAQRLGGSVTLVTHFFPNRDALIAGLLDQLRVDIDEFERTSAHIADPGKRLRMTLEWAMPLDDYGLTQERARIALVAHRDSDPAVDAFITGLEPSMRAIYRHALQGVVPDEDVDVAVDLLRSWVNGICLSAVEHPDLWTADRQLRALKHFLRMLDLDTSLDWSPATTA